MSGEGTGGGGFRRPALTKGGTPASTAQQPFYALGKKQPPSQRVTNAAAVLFGTSDPVTSAATSSSIPPGQRKPPFGGSGVAAGNRPQTAKDLLKSHKLPAVAPSRAVAISSGSFQRTAAASAALSRQEHGQKAEQGTDADGKNLANAVKLFASGDHSLSDAQFRPLICGAIRQICGSRHKEVDEVVLLSLSRLAVIKPMFFRSDPVLTAVMSLIKRDPVYNSSVGFKSKSTVVNCIIGTNLLFTVLQGIPRWPEAILKLYLEDAAIDRHWVDLAETKEFVKAIRFSLATRAPNVAGSVSSTDNASGDPKPGQSPRHLSLEEVDRLSPSPKMSAAARASSPSLSNVSDHNFPDTGDESHSHPHRVDRFADLKSDLPQMIMDVISNIRGGDGGKNLIRLLTSAAGIPVVRVYAMQRIDAWMTNSKTANAAMYLMATVCANCEGKSDEDIGIIAGFLKIRCKSKPIIDTYFQCLSELLERNPENLYVIIKMTLDTELADMAIAKRNPWTLTVMAATVRLKPEESSTILGNLFSFVIITSHDDMSRNLKIIMHELAKQYKTDIRQEKFLVSLLSGRTFMTHSIMSQLKAEDQPLRDRKLLLFGDVILAAEALMMMTRYKDDVANGNTGVFTTALASLQNLSIEFLSTSSRKWFLPSQEATRSFLRKIFFLEKHSMFQIMDKWPTEHERTLFFKVASRIPVTSHIIDQVMSAMSSCEPQMFLDLLEVILVRALSLRSEELGVLRTEDLAFTVCESFFKCGLYKLPENVSLPSKYRPPQLIRRDVYWHCWKLITILAAADPPGFGAYAWGKFPTVCALMQMSIISRFEFPAETMISAEKDKRHYMDQEQKITEDERRAIVDLENRIAGGNAKTAIVTENTAKLPKDYLRFDPGGIFRQPPDSFLSGMEKLNKQVELGKLLSGCRKPDFLLEMLNEKGTAASLPWLLELTTDSKSMFDILPVECVCEMLSNSLLKKPSGSADQRGQDFSKCCSLALRLSDSIIGKDADVNNVMKTLNFFSDRLCSETVLERNIAKVALEIFFDPEKIDSSLANLWGSAKSESPVPEHRTRRGSSAAAEVPDAHEPEVTKVSSRSPYWGKFKWLLVDAEERSVHFQILKDNLCLQLAKALEVECDTLSVCAYLEFISIHWYFRPKDFSQAEKFSEYLIVQIIADIVVNRVDLRDALFLPLGKILSIEELRRIRAHTVSLFETFLDAACEVTPEVFGDLVVDGRFMDDPMLRVAFTLDKVARTACLSVTVTKAFPVLMALIQDVDDCGGDVLLPFCVNTDVLFDSKTWFTQVPVPVMTAEVRQIVLLGSRISAFVQCALIDIPDEELFTIICCENVSFENLSQMINIVEPSNRETMAALKFIAGNHPLICRTLLEYRFNRGLTLEDPVHSTIQSTLTSAKNPFAVPFMG